MYSGKRQEYQDDGDWTEKFIVAVQNRPPIYNTGLPEHSDRKLISRLWNEITEIMVPTWQDMTSNEKFAKGKDLQHKWRNLKTCFRRELKKQKKETSGQSVNKRRKYVYFDQLLFLLPTMEDRSTLSECSPCNTQGDNSESEDESQSTQATERLNGDAIDNTPEPGASTQQLRTPKNNRKFKAKSTKSYEYSLLAILKDKKEEAFDEDKSFLLSLVPTFKKLNDVQKIDAKMEFLSTLKRLTQPPRHESFYHLTHGHGTYPRYGPQQSFAENFVAQPNPSRLYTHSVENYPSGSSTPNPASSEISGASTNLDFVSLQK